MSFLDRPGDLAEVPVAAVLIEALNHRVTGVLIVDHGHGLSRLYIRDGIPVAAQSFTAFMPIGAALAAAGTIDGATLERSLVAMARTGKRQGDVLVEMGAVDRPQVNAALAEQQEAYLAEVAALTRGRFTFDPAAAVPRWTDEIRFSPLKAIVRALETPQAAHLVTSAFDIAQRGPVRLAPGYRQLAGAFGWSAAEAALVDRLAVLTSLDAFLADSRVGRARASAILAALLLLGLAAAQSTPADAEAVPGLIVDLADVVASPEPPPTPRRSDPDEARRRRQRLLHQAMVNMGVGPFAGQPPASPRVGDAAAPPVQAPANAAGLGKGDGAELRAALATASPRARSADLFERLGLQRGATPEQVKTAYLQLARQLHPDRFSAAALADVAVEVRELFAAINEAYDTLSDERKRAAYLARMESGSGMPPAQREAAAVDFQKAEACVRTRDFPRARGYYEAAVRADPRPEYLASYASMLYAEHRAGDRAKAKALAEAALRDPRCDRASLVRGLLARDEGDHVAAERLFRRALEANPQNAEAQRELRAYEARQARTDPFGGERPGRKR